MTGPAHLMSPSLNPHEQSSNQSAGENFSDENYSPVRPDGLDAQTGPLRT